MICYPLLTEVGKFPLDFSIINWHSIPNLDTDNADRQELTVVTESIWSYQIVSYTHICIYIYMDVWMDEMYVCMYVCMYGIYVCLNVCMYV